MEPETTAEATTAVEAPKAAPKKPAKAKTTTKPKATKPATNGKPKPKVKPAGDNKMSLMDAAAKVLSGAKEPMGVKAMVEAAEKKGLWSSPGGKTPAATLYSSILREMDVKGTKSRFKKKDRGLFVATAYASK